MLPVIIITPCRSRTPLVCALTAARESQTMPVQDTTTKGSSVPESWTIYELIERDTDRRYVGVTQRPLPIRITTHIGDARRDRPAHADGLRAALRRMAAAGQTFDEAFDAHVLDYAGTPQEARQKELAWIERLNCGQPCGFNILPGRGSLGSPASSGR